jgi:hypothetical protein
MGQRHIGLILVCLFAILLALDPRPVWLLAMIISGFVTGWSYGPVLVNVGD